MQGEVQAIGVGLGKPSEHTQALEGSSTKVEHEGQTHRW